MVHHETFVSDSGEHLNISYPNFEELLGRGINDKGVELDLYDEYFDRLNNYKSCKSMFFETDFITCLPKNIKKFVNLESLTVEGGRFWDLDVSVMPDSLKFLDVSEQSNLNHRFHNNIDNHLPNLEHLIVPAEKMEFHLAEFEQPSDSFTQPLDPLPILSKLEYLTLVSCYPHHDPVGNVLDVVKENVFLKNYADRISSVIYDRITSTYTVRITKKC